LFRVVSSAIRYNFRWKCLTVESFWSQLNIFKRSNTVFSFRRSIVHSSFFAVCPLVFVACIVTCSKAAIVFLNIIRRRILSSDFFFLFEETIKIYIRHVEREVCSPSFRTRINRPSLNRLLIVNKTIIRIIRTSLARSSKSWYYNSKLFY